MQVKLSEFVVHKTPPSQAWLKDLVLIFPVLPVFFSCALAPWEAYCALSQKVQGQLQPRLWTFTLSRGNENSLYILTLCSP